MAAKIATDPISIFSRAVSRQCPKWGVARDGAYLFARIIFKCKKPSKRSSTREANLLAASASQMFHSRTLEAVKWRNDRCGSIIAEIGYPHHFRFTPDSRPQLLPCQGSFALANFWIPNAPLALLCFRLAWRLRGLTGEPLNGNSPRDLRERVEIFPSGNKDQHHHLSRLCLTFWLTL